MDSPPQPFWWRPPNRAPANVIKVNPKVRLSVLTQSCVRMEYHALGDFEDAPTYAFCNRGGYVDNSAPAGEPIHKTMRTDKEIVISTQFFTLVYVLDSKFDEKSLTVMLNHHTKPVTWGFGSREHEAENLLGTMRTLDVQSTSKRGLGLQPGLLSRAGFSVIDDSRTLVFNTQGWLSHRTANKESRVATVGVEPLSVNTVESYDVYYFAYGTDYARCLRDFALLSGPVPMLPQYAFGLTWSKYWPYSQQDLVELVEEFEQHDLPLAAICIDMDWHREGWTGYSWNRELIPNPGALLAFMQRKNVRVTLNLHPADGCQVHEDAYEEFAKFMGRATSNSDPEAADDRVDLIRTIQFDITDPRFMEGYFRFLHRPLEQQGVSFWWIDWQQGAISSVVGFDPLAWLNHLHFHDLQRNGTRPYILSRYGGGQRYQLGFSGDTVASWKYLQLLPCFTATASNVLFNWSHDTGGFHWATNDPELYVRWFQFAALSPTVRLHSTRRRFEQRLPWGFDLGVEAIVKNALQLRQTLMPYIYTAHYLQHTEAEPLIGPTYFHYPTEEPAYIAYHQYFLGKDLLVCPYGSESVCESGHHVPPLSIDEIYLEARNTVARLSRTVVWIPPGRWFDFFSGQEKTGKRWAVRWGSLSDCAHILAPAGAVIPTTVTRAEDRMLELLVFPYGTRTAILYEAQQHSITRFTSEWDERKRRLRVTISAQVCPPQASTVRSVSIRLRGMQQSRGDAVRCERKKFVRVEGDYVVDVVWQVNKKVSIDFYIVGDGGEAQKSFTLQEGERIMQAGDGPATLKDSSYTSLAKLVADGKVPWVTVLPEACGQALLESLCGLGAYRITHPFTNREMLVLWNYSGDQRFYYTHNGARCELTKERPEVLTFDTTAECSLVTVHYDTLTRVVFEFGRKTDPVTSSTPRAPLSPRGGSMIQKRISKFFRE